MAKKSLKKIIQEIKEEFPEQVVLQRIDDAIPEASENYAGNCPEYLKEKARNCVIKDMLNIWAQKYNSGKELNEITSEKIEKRIIKDYSLK